MGEIIEINVASADRTIYVDLLNFMRKYTNVTSDDCEILRIDDWNYSNETRLNNYSEIENWLDTKIICITEKSDIGSIGLYIEKENEVFSYDIWFNPKKEMAETQYADFKEKAVSFLKGIKLDIACIGKELSIDYSKGYEKAIEVGRGIEYIIVSKIVEEKYGISTIVNQKKVKPDFEVI